MTIGAKAGYGPMINFGQKLIFRFDLLNKIGKALVGQRRNVAAFAANEMMVRCRGSDFIDGLPVNCAGKQQVYFGKKVERSVHGGLVDGGGDFVDSFKNFGGGCVAIKRANSI